jgi:hypothetical protein
MGMSTHVIGIVPPDDHFKRMKKVWYACEDAGIEIPKEVLAFFNNEEPDEQGVVVTLPKTCVFEHHADMQDGFEIDITKLPAGVKRVRFYNSY